MLNTGTNTLLEVLRFSETVFTTFIDSVLFDISGEETRQEHRSDGMEEKCFTQNIFPQRNNNTNHDNTEWREAKNCERDGKIDSLIKKSND